MYYKTNNFTKVETRDRQFNSLLICYQKSLTGSFKFIAMFINNSWHNSKERERLQDKKKENKQTRIVMNTKSNK